MRAIIITAAAWLAMACGEAGDGAVEAALGLGDLTAAEREMVEERFGHEFIEAEANGVAAEALFGFARCDLNGAAPQELVAVGRSSAHCTGAELGSSPVCGVWALAPTADGWVQVLESAGAPRLAASTNAGWRDFVMERGGAPVVFKFAGVAYEEDAGAFDPEPDALEGWLQDGLDPLSVTWFAFDDAMPEEAEAVFRAFYAGRFLLGGGRMEALPDEFRIGLAELDGAAPEEVVVQGASAAFCGPEGCRHWILRGGDGIDGGGPEELGEATGFDLRVAMTRRNGMRDLVIGGERGLFVWRFDGARYRLAGDD